MTELLTAESWDEALVLLEQLGCGTHVTVSKADEPALPPGLRLRRSNVPWSVHKGATAVYRQDTPGTHVQIRDYADRWVVELDNHNPRYRPARHVAVDTREYVRTVVSQPLWSLTGVTLFTPVRSVQFAEEMATLAAGTPLSLLARGLETARKGLPVRE